MTRLIGLVAMAATVACGGGGDGANTPTFTTSVPASTPLGQLGSADVTTLCGDLSSFGDTLVDSPAYKQGNCKITGAAAAFSLAFLGAVTTDADLRSVCKQTYDQCVAAPAQASTGACTAPPATCAATVGQYAACLNDSTAATLALFSQVPACNQITVASLSADGGTTSPATPASCVAFSAACPDTGGLPRPAGSSTPAP